MVDLTGATEPVGAAVPTGAGTVLLTKVGGGTGTDGATEGTTEAVPTGVLIGAALGTGVTLAGGATALVATSVGVEETGIGAGDDETGTGAGEEGTTTTELETTGGAGTALVGTATGVELMTGLVTVQGQSVIVNVVAWREESVMPADKLVEAVNAPQSRRRWKTRG